MEALVLIFMTVMHQNQTQLILGVSEKHKVLCLE
jgi:hypothetical protein